MTTGIEVIEGHFARLATRGSDPQAPDESRRGSMRRSRETGEVMAVVPTTRQRVSRPLCTAELAALPIRLSIADLLMGYTNEGKM
jgi:hypothetical protein